MKNLKRNTIIILIITLGVLYFSLKDQFQQVVTTLLRVDLKFILVAICCYAVYIFLKAWVTYISVGDAKKISLLEAVKHNIITQFFNGITPFSTGGQPMEIYMLHEHGIRSTKATNIIMLNFIFYQVALVLFGICAVIYNQITGVLSYHQFLGSLVLIGFLINTGIAFFLLFLASSKKFTNLIVSVFLKLGEKFHFIKNREEQKEKWEERLNDFHQYTKELKQNKTLFFVGVVANFIGLFCFYAIPLFIVYSLHDFTSLHLFEAITASAYVLIMGSFVPIPGASGGIEYGFVQFFGNFIAGSKISAVLLIWRFITYYLGMIVGAICFNFHHGRSQK